MALKQMALRYAGVCRVCSVELPARTTAVYDTEARNVLCLACRDRDRPADPLGFLPPPQPIDHGVAGAGPQAEYDRRAAKRQAELDAIPGLRGKLVRAFDTEPQSTTAWAQGAEGERRLAAALEAGLTSSAIVLHSRKVPNTRGDIDHLIVAPSGIWIVDAKNYTGKPELRDVGGFRRPEWRLYVNGRNQTKLVENFEWQVTAVRAALDPIGFGSTPIHPTLLFTQWKKGLFERPIELRGVVAMWTKKLVELANEPGPLGDDAIRTIATHLSAKLPAKR
jgi:hypothetical protein